MDDTAIYLIAGSVVGILVLVFVIVWNRLGGWPEAHYRIWGISWFRQVIFEEDGTAASHIIKTEKIHHSLPSFDNAGSNWTIDTENDARYHGRPSRYFNRGDSRQIPIKTWTKPGDRWDPELLKTAYDDDSIERARAIGRKLPFPVIWIFAVAVIACVVAGIAAYYSHDTYCALKPLNC